jgi:steroid delta-isomerase-like uncharacterized protein
MGVSRNGVWLHLSSFSGDGVSGGVVYLAVDDVDALHAELVAKGIRIDLVPTDQTWGNREMYVQDADRNSIRFVQRPHPASLVRELHDRVWSAGDLSAVERLVAPKYVVHSDPGDPWEGQTLDRATYCQRVMYSRSAFPDLVFTVHDVVATDHRVAVRWSAEGTHQGDLPGLPATGKRLRFAGQTIYEIAGDQIAGHWQVVDRLGFIQQLQSGSF